ncbi:S8 family peptidase [Flindersiella endophytica]
MPRTGGPLRRALGWIAGGALAVGLLTAAGPPGEDGRPAVGTSDVQRSWRVTLVTGDVVRVDRTARGYRAEPTPGAGRENITFGIRQLGGEISVYPSDAVPLVMNGSVDERLFEVTSLVEDGLDDAATKDLRVLVAGAELPASAKAVRTYESLELRAVRTPKAKATALWTKLRTARTGRAKIWLDAKVRASLDQSVPQVGAPAAWEKGFTGKGIRVAVLDTGIDTDHPDLTGSKVVAEHDFTDSGTPDDRFGHGTHVASTIAGTGAASGGRFKGVAPGAQLINGKVLDDSGFGSTSDIIAGMEWAVGQGADVVNLSLGGNGDGYGTDPMSQAVNRLTESTGTLFVVAAGNSGDGERTIGAPGDADRALTVAAANRDRTTADFSSRGPRYYDRAMKPDLAAPGVDIAAARAAGAVVGDPVDEHYSRLSGTSMATPHVAGAAAILAQRYPKAGADRLKALLMGSATAPLGASSVFEQGAGFLDVAKAIEQPVWAAGGSVSAFLDWPHEGPAVENVTYRNDGDQPLALRLAFSPADSAGHPAPKGLFRMPDEVTVPAGGSRTVRLVVDPARAALGTQYQGTILAKGRGTAIRTPVAVFVEGEKHDVTFEYVTRDGEPITATGQGNFAEVPIIVNVETGEAEPLRMTGGKLVARVAPGRYTSAEHILGWDGEELVSSTLVAAPEIVVGHAGTTVRLDAREARPARFSGDVTTTNHELLLSSLVQRVGDLPFYAQFRDRGGQSELYVLATEPVEDRPYWFSLYMHLVGADGTRYSLVDGERGRLPDDPTYPVDAGQLADLTLEFATPGDEPLDGLVALHGDLEVDGLPLQLLNAGPRVRPPGRQRILVTADAFGTKPLWSGGLELTVPPDFLAYADDLPPSTYVPGERRTYRFGAAAWGASAQAYHGSDGSLGVRLCPVCPAGSDYLTYVLAEPPVGHTVLKRDGETIAEEDTTTGVYVENQTGTGTYTVELTAEHTLSYLAYARKVSGSWTFRSSPAPAGDDSPVGTVIDARVTGPFDLRGRAAPGTTLPLTIDVVGGDRATMSTPELAISYDDGATWRDLEVRQVDGHWVADETTPNVEQAFASLRIRVADGAGSSTDVTTHRAFQVGTP